MNIDSFIEELESNQIFVSLQEEQLKISASKEKITSEIVTQIRSHKLELIAYLQSHEARRQVVKVSFKSHNKTSFELSHAQKRLWIISQFPTSKAAYNIINLKSVDVKIDQKAFRQAFSLLSDRHDILRTVFKANSGTPRQVVYPAGALLPYIEFVDLTKFDSPETELQNYQDQEYESEFDLSVGPLLRVIVLQLSFNHTVVLTNIHHIIADGWSIKVLEEDFFALYQGLMSGEMPEMEPLPIQYIDYTIWQRDQIRNGVLEESRTFWHRCFAGELPQLQLVTEKARPAQKTYRGKSLKFLIQQPQSEALGKLSSDNGGTLFMGLMTLVNALLYRYSGQTDIVIGSPIAGRNQLELEKQIGFYVNTLPIRTTFSKEINFKELLLLVVKNIFDAYEHQDYPFDLLIDELGLDVDMSRNPLFDVMVVLQNQQSQEAFNWTEGHIEIDEDEVSKFDITLSFTETSTGLLTYLVYNKDLFTDERMMAMVKHLQSLLQAVLEKPEAPLSSHEYLTQQERQILLQDFNGTKMALPKRTTVLDLFKEQVRQRPEAVALSCYETQRTYKELDEQSDYIAHLLKEKYKPSAGDIFGLLMDRNEAFVVAMLAVFKNSAAFLPIPLSYPNDRVAQLLESSGSKALIVERELPEISFKAVEALSNWQQPAKTHEPFDYKTSPSDAAYVIYTSGSTGNPKGVMIGHLALLNFCLSNNALFKVSEKSKSSMYNSIGFDASVWDIWPYFCVGACVVPVPEDIRLDTKKLVDFYKTEGVTHSFLTTSFCEQLQAEPHLSPDLVIMTGGDRMRKVIPNPAELYHNYGPTETTVIVTSTSLSSSQPDPDLPIGKPLPNTEILLLDDNLQLVPIGGIGQIAIGGIQLASGYLNEPELSARKFVSHPFSKGKKLYMSGDLGRWRWDGQLIFEGRIDDQIKIRGYRIELGEIENRLMKYPSIDRALVRVFGQDGDKSIIAYYTGTSIDDEDLQLALQQSLPYYMIPSKFIYLDEFPLNANNKIDRKKLPDPISENELDSHFEGPVNEQEKQLVGIWKEVLQKYSIGVEQNFFELGGHSLKAVQIISRVYKVFGEEITLKDLFDYPTVRELVKARLTARSTKSNLEKVEPEPALHITTQEGCYELSFAQRRLWILSQFDFAKSAYNIVRHYVIEKADAELVQKAWRMLIERHESLRTTFIKIDGRPYQKIAPFVPEDYCIDTLDIKDSENELNIIKNSLWAEEIDIELGPLIKTTLVKVGEETSVLVLVIHHLISDGWSLNVLSRDFKMFYESLLTAGTPKLPSLNFQYKDYVSRQHQLLANGSWEQHREYWGKTLQGPLPVLQLPTDHRRPPLKTYEGETIQFTFNTTYSKRFERYCKEQGATLFMGFIALTNALLSRLVRKGDIIVGSPIANRYKEEYENQIGFYVNTLILRNQFELSISFKELLALVRENTLNAYQYQDFPFDLLVEELDLPRDLSRNPVFDVMVIHQSQQAKETNPPAAGELVVEENDISKFDLTFTFSESDQGIVCDLNYNTNLFQRGRAKRLAGQLQEIFETLINQTSEPINKINFIPSAELKQIATFNNTEFEFHREGTTIQWIQQALDNNPNGVALMDDNHQLTNGQLQEKANQLAHFLRKTLDVKKDALIGLMVDRNINMVVYMLAIHKAGAAYVPIDKKYPEERKRYIISNSQVCALLTDDEYSDEHCIVFNTEDFEKSTCNFSVDNPEHVNTTDDRSHIIYTSGSTGKPKGVEIEHRNVTSFLAWCKEEFKHCSYDRALASTSYCFDLSVFEIFYHLSAGIPIQILESGSSIPKYVNQGDKILINTVPSVVEYLLKEQMDWSAVTALNMAGEPIPDFVFQNLNYEGMEVRNLYGPSEDTTYSTSYRLHGTEDIIPIGKPISNTKIYVLDEQLQQQPIGVIGEIVIAGEGLARGYIKNPGATAARFIPNPYTINERLYLTGDLGKWSEDGVLLYEGRKDFQVKIRGFRIELGEIEKAILGYEGVNTTVVSAFEHNKEKHLIAYYDGRDIESNDLKEHLKKKIPYYMIPSHFMYLDEFPLNSNGKLDRKALPLPHKDHAESDAEGKVEGPVQKALLQIWEEVLERKNIGPRAVFFELGGHSLKAMQALTRIVTSLKVEITLPEFFNNPTIEAQAQLVENKTCSEVNVITPLAQKAYYDVSNAQRRLWVIEQFEESKGVYNIPQQYDFQDVNIDIFRLAWREVIDRHEALRTVLVMHQGHLQQKILEVDALDELIEVRKNENFGEEELQKEFNTLSRWHFDLEQGPLFKAILFRLSDGNFKFMLVIHHIIYDGWSMTVLRQDFMQCYQDLLDGTSIKPNPLPIHYKDFSAWQNEQLYSGVWSQHRAWWLQTLGGIIPAIQLPCDYPRPTKKTYRGATLGFLLPEGICNQLYEYCKGQNATPFIGLTAICTVLLHKYTGQDDIILGSPIAGRHHPGLEDQVGFYVNTVAIRTHLEPDEGFAQLFGQVKEMVLNTYSHQDYPFDMLVEDLDVARDMSRSPIFDVMISQPDFEDKSDVSWGGTKQQVYFQEGEVAKYDLTFAFMQCKEGLICQLNYNQDLFSKEKIHQMARHFKSITESLLTNTDLALSAVEYMTEEEKQNLQHIPVTHRSVCNENFNELFNDQVRTKSLQIALVDSHTKWTYAMLDQKTNQVAHYLIELSNNGADFVLGICLEKSAWFALAIIGAMKAGIDHLIIDPKDQNQVLREKSINLLLLDDGVNGPKGSKSIHIGALDEAAKAMSDTAVANVTISFPALWSSSACGELTSVRFTNPSIVKHALWLIKEVYTDKQALGSHWSVPSNVYESILQAITTFLAGDTLLVGEEKNMEHQEAFVTELKQLQIGFFYTTPEFLFSIINLLRKSQLDLPLVKCVIVLGGKVSETLQSRFYEVFSYKVKLINALGGNVLDPFEILRKVTPQQNNPLTTMAGSRLCVVDSFGARVPLGVPGFLAVYSKSGNEDFSTSGHISKERAFFSTEGSLQHLGNVIDQIWVAGNVFDKTEIESYLLAHPDVEEVVVIVNHQQGADTKFSIVYTGVEFKEHQIRQHLGKKFPAYLSPDGIIQVAEITFNPGGVPDENVMVFLNLKEDIKPYFENPQTPSERILAEIWQEVLGLDQVSIEASFFELGGQSLKATQITTRIYNRIQKVVRIADIFNLPTIKELASFIDQRNENAELTEDKCLIQFGQMTSEKTHLFCIPPVAGSATVFQRLAGLLEDHFNCYGLQYPGFEEGEVLVESITAMAALFAREILGTISKGDHVIVLGYSMGALISFEIIKLLEAAGVSPKLVLLDKNVVDPLDDVTVTSKDIEQYAAYQEITHWIKDIQSKDEQRFKEFFANNLQISLRHKIEGLLNCDVLAVEASKNAIATDMGKWNDFTKGIFHHYYLEAHHLELLREEHLGKLVTHIKAFTQ